MLSHPSLLTPPQPPNPSPSRPCAFPHLYLVAITFLLAALPLTLRAQEDEFLKRIPAPFMSYHGAPWLERHDREQTERPDDVIAAMKLEKGDIVADIGCGSGYFARRIAKVVGAGGKVYGVDIQPEMLELLTKNAAKENLANIVPVLSTEDDPKLPKGEIDWMILVDVYHEFSAPEKMLAKMREALAPGGRIALVEYRAEDGTGDHIKPDHRMSARQVLIEWRPAGFELVDVQEFLPHQHLFILRAAEDTQDGNALMNLDLGEALQKEKVKITSSSADEGSVILTIQRTSPEGLLITLPAGQLFRSPDGASNRVARRDGAIELDTDEPRDWKILAVPTSINSPKAAPSAPFKIEPVSNHLDLRRVMFYIQSGGLPEDTARAAAAIVANNPTLEELSSLRPPTIALALLACDQSGVEVEKLRLWTDRAKLIEKLGDGNLKKWLQEQTE